MCKINLKIADWIVPLINHFWENRKKFIDYNKYPLYQDFIVQNYVISNDLIELIQGNVSYILVRSKSKEIFVKNMIELLSNGTIIQVSDPP